MTILYSMNEITMKKKEEGYLLKNVPDSLKEIGRGKSAVVFKIKNQNKVIKLFYPEKKEEAKIEAMIYSELEGMAIFPKLYASGEGYLVLEYIKGKTLFDYLSKGLFIKEEFIKKVDMALEDVKKRGLNPADVHLKNIIVTENEEVKIIDLARFHQNRTCNRWKELKEGYYNFYLKPYFPKKIPIKMMESVVKKYKEFEKK